MNKYLVKVSTQAIEDISNALRYIKLTKQAVKNIKIDIKETKERLKYVADSLADYKDGTGRKEIHLRKHNYKFIYSIDNNVVTIEEFLHDLQDE